MKTKNKWFCRLFHTFKYVEEYNSFLDMISKKYVYRFFCPKCKTNFLAYSKFAITRVYVPSYGVKMEEDNK